MYNNQAHAGNQQYDENFYRGQQDGSLQSAVAILSHVADLMFAVQQKNFGAEIFGINGNYVDRSQLFIPAENFHPENLEECITLNRRFDLAMTLEVAEHLTPACADSFVEDLTRLRGCGQYILTREEQKKKE